jgi:melibiose permease
VGIATAFSMKIVQTLGGGAGEEFWRTGFVKYALITSAAYILTSVYSAARVKEIQIPKAEQSTGAEKFSLAKAFSILTKNDQVFVIVVIMILFNLACNLTNTAKNYYFIYVLKDSTQLGFFGIFIGAMQTLGLFTFPFLTKRFGRPKIYTSAFILPMFGYIAMALTNRILPRQFFPLAVTAGISFIGYGLMSVMQSVMLADAVDYGEYENGTRNEGIIFSMLTFLSKLAAAFCDLITFATFAIVKFGGEDSSAVTPAAERSFSVLMYVLPPIILLIALLVYKTKYKLSPALMAQVNEELSTRRKLTEAKTSPVLS